MATFVRRHKPRKQPPSPSPSPVRHIEMGFIIHKSLPLLKKPDYRQRFMGRSWKTGLNPDHLPEMVRCSAMACLDYIYELVQMADGFTFEPDMDGYVPDLEMYHRGYGYIVEIKTVWRASPDPAFKASFSKGKRQVKHGVGVLRHRTRHTMEIFGCVLAFLIYADGSPPEAVWKDVAHHVPPSA